ncbi:TIGR02117 family protein [Aquimarina sp. MMG016]|uniref:TIGR02117 family protein n=1 Tax=Aquimarina sp. MMG016 TaxID=2822690 RepID=UPI001B3A7731|nr:TIGR02117 family protein [Aquimarina sp. MMG016]MBQ4821481.1 TIGR02117 family protein [Aquimarina sp. MMG016]
MKLLKKILKYVGIVLVLPISYVLVSLILTYIPVNNQDTKTEKNNTIYLSSNGVHLEIIIPKKNLDTTILNKLKYISNEEYFSFGWGDKNFYVETPTWADLTLATSFRALFLNSSTLIHVTRYSKTRQDWAIIKVDDDQLKKINDFIYKTFSLDTQGDMTLLPGLGYNTNDDFYEANGNYNCLRTCNSWVNTAFKQSDIKSCLWTPFDFGLLNMHQ